MPYDIGSFIGTPSATVGGGTTAQTYTDPLTNMTYYMGTPSWEAYLKRIGGALPGTFGVGATPSTSTPTTAFGGASYSAPSIPTAYSPYTTLPTAANPTVTVPAAPGRITPSTAPAAITPTPAIGTGTFTAAPGRITPTAAPGYGTATAAPAAITPTAAIGAGTPTAAPGAITPTAAVPAWTAPSEPSWMGDLRAAQQGLQSQTSKYQSQLNQLLQQNQALQSAQNATPSWLTQLLS